MNVVDEAFAATQEYLNALQEEGGHCWFNRLLDAIALELSVPATMALLHPQWLETWLSSPALLVVRGERAFKLPVPLGQRCQAHRIWGYSCPLVSPKYIAQDHLFPYSAGGRSDAGNRVMLCERHNSYKADDVHLYPYWTARPAWVATALTRRRHAYERHARP